MTTSDIERRSSAGLPSERNIDAEKSGDGRTAPARPSLHDKPGAPVLVRVPPPFSVRLSQLAWALSLAVGATAVVYLFVIRQPQLPEIVALIKGVDETRADATYQTAADIIFWTVFGAMVLVLLVQVTLLVSFSNRRPHARWWLLATVLLSGAIFLACREIVAVGDRGVPLVQIMLVQLGLAVLGLLFAAFPGALKWTARRHDVRRDESRSLSGGDI
jgi:hypothetical protein